MASSPEARDSDSPTIIPPRLSDVPISEPSALPVSLAHKVNDRNDQQATHPSTSVGMSEIEDSSAKRRPHPLPVDNISQSVPHTEQFSTPASTPLGPLAHEPGSTHPTANSESMQANPINESSSDRQTFSDSAPHLSVNIPSQTSPITPTFTTPTEPSDVLTSGENQNRNAEMQQSLGHSQEASSQHQMQDLSGHSRSLQKRPEQPDELQRGRDRATLSRLDSTTPIGPSIENPQVQPDPSAGPAVLITLLLTTGARHPFKIDRKYLSKRGIHRAAAMGGGKTQDGAASGDTAEKKADTERADVPDPLNISVYTMKELIWRDWRDDWEPRPTSPSLIRLIHFGKLLDDKMSLRDCKLNSLASNVIHMTVRPSDLYDDDAENAKTKGKMGFGGSRRGYSNDAEEQEEAGSSNGCCRCEIM